MLIKGIWALDKRKYHWLNDWINSVISFKPLGTIVCNLNIQYISLLWRVWKRLLIEAGILSIGITVYGLSSSQWY